MSELEADMERLIAIAERILAGEPIESFELGEYEIHFVVGYCQAHLADPPAPAPEGEAT